MGGRAPHAARDAEYARPIPAIPPEAEISASVRIDLADAHIAADGAGAPKDDLAAIGQLVG